jgi:hypothetical protein
LLNSHNSIRLARFDETEHAMSSVVKLYTIPEKLAEDERLRLRALLPADYPLDELDSEASMVLKQLGLAAKTLKRPPEDSEHPNGYGGEAS